MGWNNFEMTRVSYNLSETHLFSAMQKGAPFASNPMYFRPCIGVTPLIIGIGAHLAGMILFELPLTLRASENIGEFKEGVPAVWNKSKHVCIP